MFFQSEDGHYQRTNPSLPFHAKVSSNDTHFGQGVPLAAKCTVVYKVNIFLYTFLHNGCKFEGRCPQLRHEVHARQVYG